LQFVPGFIQDLFGTLVALDRLVGFLNRPETALVGDDGYSDLPEGATDIIFNKATFSWPRGEADQPDPKAFKLRDISLQVPWREISLVWGALGSGKTLFASQLHQFPLTTAASAAGGSCT
jgi:ABC-type bacteriocin/lantibiotic exporter with double-glycine peptidase domain